MVDIQSATAEISEKKRRKKKEEVTTGRKYNGRERYWTAIINWLAQLQNCQKYFCLSKNNDTKRIDR